MTKTCCTVVAALVLGVLAAAPSAQAQTKKISYAIVDLNPWLSCDSSTPSSINNVGQIVGTSWTGQTIRQACIWDPNGVG